jgi:hypothetical protein
MVEAERFKFEKVGLGYRSWPTNDKVVAELKVSHIKRKSGDLHGFLQVSCNFAGVKTINGVLHSTRFNLSAGQTRKQVATLLKSRTPGFEEFDWFDALEYLCQHVEIAESQGEPIVAVGTDRPPVQRSTRLALDPLVPANVAALLYGPGGAGKSVLALAGALSVATDTEVIPGVPPRISGPVLYLDWETDAATVNDRLWSLCTGAGVQPANVSYRRCNRPLADDAEELAMLVGKMQIVYMVIDSCGPAMGTSGEYGDANESTLRLFEAIRHIGISTQIVDHVSKQEMRSSKGTVAGLLPYGSIYKVNLSRAAWELRNSTSADDEQLRISLHNTKANDARLHEPIRLLLDWSPDRIAFSADDGSVTPAEVSGNTWRDKLRNFLLEDDEPPRETKEVAKLLVTTDVNIRNLIQRYPGDFSRPEEGSTKVMLTSHGGVGGGSNVVSFMAARGPNDLP